MSELKKKCTVVMLPTQQEFKSRDILLKDSEGFISHTATHHIWDASEWRKTYEIQHLYICSADEIKEGDYLYSTELKVIVGPTKDRYLWIKNEPKIIASTDSSLNLPTVSDSFIQKYITQYNTGTPITDVMVGYTLDNIPGFVGELIVDTPKVRGNEIIITRCKDSWSRDEVESICWLLYTEGRTAETPLDFKSFMAQHL